MAPPNRLAGSAVSSSRLMKIAGSSEPHMRYAYRMRSSLRCYSIFRTHSPTPTVGHHHAIHELIHDRKLRRSMPGIPAMNTPAFRLRI